MKRDELLSVLKVASGALSSQEGVPALASFFFRDGRVHAYDDDVAISTPCDFPIEGGILGKPLLTWLGASSAIEVEIESVKGGARLKCGRSKLEVSVLPSSMFVHKDLELVAGAVWAPVNLLEAIEACAPCMGDDGAQPWMRGMALRVTKEGRCDVWASNNLTLGAGSAIEEGATGDVGVLLSPRFVVLLLAMTKTLGLESLRFGAGCVEAVLENETVLVAKTLSGFSATQYSTKVEALCGLAAKKWVPVPEGFDTIVDRVKRMSSVMDKGAASLSVKGGMMSMSTGAQDSGLFLTDAVSVPSSYPEVSVLVNPALLGQLLGKAKDLSILPMAVGVRAEGFVGFMACVH